MKTKTIIRLFALLFCLAPSFLLVAQSSSKSKSKDRDREKDDRKFPVVLENSVSINSVGTDFAPAYYENGIMFVSARGKIGPRDERGEPFSGFFFSPFDPNGDPSSPSRFEFDSRKKSPLHEGPLCFTRDFKTAFITRTNNKDGVRKASKSGKSKLKIYTVQFDRPDWTAPVELPFNDDEYSCVHPSLSADGRKLFFASDMPGGFGGYDLYVVERDSAGGYGLPQNLGGLINTEGNELYPFIAFSGALFFSSNGRANTRGGLDIYYVNNPLKNPEEVVNLNAPFNSPKDDKSFIIDPDGKTGFFASDRERGYGEEDIYRFVAPRGLEGISKPEFNPAKFIVTDARTGDPLQNASIRILQTSTDGFISGNNDFYSIDLLPVQDKKNALTLQIVRKNAPDLGTPDLYSNVAGEAQSDFTRYRSYMVLVSLDGYRTMERLISVETEDPVLLRFNMSEAPPCIRAGGVVLTDEFGTRIAGAEVKFEHRSSGYKDMVRTTMNGEYDICLPLEGDYVITLEREGFKTENVRFTAVKGKKAFNEIRLRPLEAGISAEASMPLANGIREGSVIIMDKIFYEYNKTTLNQSAVRHLEALLELMKRYPEMEIDIAVHTDVRGDAALNQELTDERAKNAKIYLTYRGIDAARINAAGKGETEPRNRCIEGMDDCSDEEHQQNNRLEIKIRKLGTPIRP